MKNGASEDSKDRGPAYRVAADVCFSADEDGTIILDVYGGKFHSLIQGGSKVWSVLAAHGEGITESELVNQLMDHDEEFAQEPRDRVEAAIHRILQQLTRDGLLGNQRVAPVLDIAKAQVPLMHRRRDCDSPDRQRFDPLPERPRGCLSRICFLRSHSQVRRL